ncbi:MAG: non-heme iron oxygenase ferredoxin subunit [Proteobacteria bacterium]|nr:non-heme iron oxygenase ferredoxin subunit [Pseudomonadota bacterium]
MAWLEAIEASKVGENQVVGVKVAGQPVAIYRLDGEFFATHDICTHEEASLSEGYVEGGCIECPLHQARFNIRTGAAESAPASVALLTYSTKVEGDRVLIDIPAS